MSDGGEAIGIVPAFVFDVPLDLVMPPALARVILPFAKGPLKGFSAQRTFFIGNVAGEEGHVGLPERALGDAAVFIHASARAKATELRAPMLVWKDFPESDRGALDALLAGGRVFRIASYPGTSIPIVAGGYEQFLAGRVARQRRRVAVRLRRGEEALALRSEVVKSPIDADLRDIFALFKQTEARATTRFERLTPEFFRTIAASEESEFIVMRDASGAMRAFMLLLNAGSRAVNQFVGIDYSAGDEAYLHFRLFVAAYDHASRSGATTLFSGQTGYRAKLDLGHALMPLWNYCEHANGIVNRIFRWGGSGISWETLDPQLAEYLQAHPEDEIKSP